LTLSDCYFLSDKGLEAIATGCKELTHLEVNGCHNIGTLGLESVGKSCQYVFFTNLSSLKCYRCVYYNSCVQQTPHRRISIGSWENVLEQRNLFYVSLFNVCNYSWIILWCVGCSCMYKFYFLLHRHLSELALLYCQRIGDAGLLQIGQGCKYLQALHLVDCSSIGDEAMCGIASGCKNLKKLHIRRCYEVLSAFMLVFLTKWPFCMCNFNFGIKLILLLFYFIVFLFWMSHFQNSASCNLE